MEAILPAAPSSLGRARTMLGDIRDTPRELVENAKLVLTELLANEIKHGRYPPGEPLVCRVERGKHAVHLEVSHKGPEFQMPSTPAAPSLRLRETGWGLALITHLASRWGMRDRNGSRVVWAEIDLPAPGAAAH